MSADPRKEETYYLIYNGQQFAVVRENIRLNSRLLRRMVDDSPKNIRIDGELPESSFREFARAMNGEDFDMTIENIDDLINFGEQFQTMKLLEILYEEKEQLSSPENILLKAVDNYRKKIPIDNYIPRIAENITLLIQVPQLSLFPVSIIQRIFEREECKPKNQGDVLKFFEALLDLKAKSENPSVLFKFVDFTKLGFEEIEHLLSIPKLSKKEIIEQISKAACSIIDISRSEADFNGESIKKKNEEIEEMKDKINVLESHKESIEKHKAAAHRRLEEARKKKHDAQLRMRDVEIQFRRSCQNSVIPALPKVNKTTTRRRPNRFVEWANAGFPDEGPTPKQVSDEKGKKATKPVSQPLSTIKVEAPSTKLSKVYDPSDSYVPKEPTPQVIPPEGHLFKVEKPAFPTATYTPSFNAPPPRPSSTSSITIERPKSNSGPIISIQRPDKKTDGA